MILVYFRGGERIQVFNIVTKNQSLGSRFALPLRTFVIVAFAFSVLTLAFTYPLVLAPGTANRFDSPDALLNAWILDWVLYQLPRDPLHLFNANIFFPELGSLAYSENLVTAAVLVAPIRLISDNPILLYNIALTLAFVTTALSAFLLARDVTGDDRAAGLAGVLFAFGPYHWAHIPHLQLQLAFGIPLTIYFLRRICQGGGHSVGIALALTIAATLGSSAYYAIYLLTILPVIALYALSQVKPKDRLTISKDLGLWFFAAGVFSLPLILPYIDKLRSGAVRSLAAAESFSAGWEEYISSFSRVHFFLPKSNEPLFPGFVALALAVIAIFIIRNRDSWCWIGVGAFGIGLSLGPSSGIFSLLHQYFPPYQGLRVPSRAGILVLLAVSMLAAIGLTKIRNRIFQWALLVAVAVECFAGPLPWQMTAPTPMPLYEQLKLIEEEGALVELPLPPPEQFQGNAIFVYRSITHRRPLVNGYSGFVPQSYHRSYQQLMRKKLARSLKEMRLSGVRFVLAHEARLGPRMIRQLRDAERDKLLALIGQDGPDRLYRILEGRR